MCYKTIKLTLLLATYFFYEFRLFRQIVNTVQISFIVGSLKQKTTETNQTLQTNSFTLILTK